MKTLFTYIPLAVEGFNLLIVFNNSSAFS